MIWRVRSWWWSLGVVLPHAHATDREGRFRPIVHRHHWTID
jgi:hypothetical protein